MLTLQNKNYHTKCKKITIYKEQQHEVSIDIVIPRLLVSLIIVFGLHFTLYLLDTYGHVILNSLQELPQQIYEFFAANSRNMIMYQTQNMRNLEHLRNIRDNNAI